VAAFKPAYLIHGDDHGRIGERRARLRALAERESGAGGVEVLEGDDATPQAAAAALSAMTFALGRRFVIVDGVQGWKEAEVTEHLAPVLKDPLPETTVAFFAREEGRAKVPAALVKAVERAASCRAGCAARPDGWGSSSTTPAPVRSSPRSATGSSGCCASWRSSPWSTARARG
jgi:DNA polymerase III delta subunit